MLVLSRKLEESIRIFEDGRVKLTVLKVKNNKKVDIGIEAPKDIRITRREIFDQKNK